MQFLLHRVRNVVLRDYVPENAQQVSITIELSERERFGTYAEFELTLFGLPTNVAEALVAALKALPEPIRELGNPSGTTHISDTFMDEVCEPPAAVEAPCDDETKAWPGGTGQF